jgi:hypothetical protein
VRPKLALIRQLLAPAAKDARPAARGPNSPGTDAKRNASEGG